MTTKAAARPRSSEFYRELAEKIEKAKDELVIEEIVKSLTKVELVILIKRLGRRQVENGAYTISAQYVAVLKRQATEVSELQATIATQEELIEEITRSRDYAERESQERDRQVTREIERRQKAESDAATQRLKAEKNWADFVEMRGEVERLDRLSEKRAVRRITRGIGTAWSKLDDRTQRP